MARVLVSLALLVAACGDNHDSDKLDLDDVSGTTAEDTPLTVDVPLTASKPKKVSIHVATQPTHGTVTGSDTHWTYTPTENYNGGDSFVVEASLGTQSVSATVTITVTPVNDPPIAHADSFPAGFDTPLTVAQTTLLANDSDIEGDALHVSAVTAGTHGTVALSGTDVVFTPELGFQGTAMFTYTVSDGMATTDATVTVSIGDDMPPVAVDDTAMTDEDVTLALADSVVLANDTDPENHTLAVSAVANPTHGTVTHAGTTITFVPAANYHGPATFEYTVTDGFKTDIGLVTVTVNSINDNPVAIDDLIMTNEDTAVSVTAASLAANDTDVDGDTLTVTGVAATATTHGSVAMVGTDVTYTPAANYNGPASFAYTISDGHGGTATGTVHIDVLPVQDAPVAVDDTRTTAEDTADAFAAATLAANDTDADLDTLTVTAVTATANTHGTVSLSGGTITYTPAANYNGAAAFDYTVSDGHGGTDTGTVNYTVTPVDDPPVAVDDNPTVVEGSTANTIDVLANDTDIDNGPKTVTAVSTAAHGTVAIAPGGGSVRYTPAAAYCNEGPNVPRDSFTYTLNGGSIATVRVTVTCACGLGKTTDFVVGAN